MSTSKGEGPETRTDKQRCLCVDAKLHVPLAVAALFVMAQAGNNLMSLPHLPRPRTGKHIVIYSGIKYYTTPGKRAGYTQQWGDADKKRC